MTTRNIRLMNATYSNVPAVQLPIDPSGTATFTEITDTTATASDVAAGKYFYDASGVKTLGTASGGGSNDFIITVSWDGVNNVWAPDCSYADVTAAYSDGKNITVQTDVDSWDASADGYYDNEENWLIYTVFRYDEDTLEVERIFYLFDNDGVHIDGGDWYFSPNKLYQETVTPTQSIQTLTPTTGYVGFNEVTVNAIPSQYVVPSGNCNITSNGNNIDVAQYATASVNVSGGGNFTLLGTKTLGTISTSSTTDTDTGQTIVLTGWNDYDLLICECSVATQTNSRHLATTRLAWLTASGNINTKNGCTFATATWNAKKSSSAVVTARSSTTAYGVYAKAGTISGSNLTLTIYQRYNSTQTGTINGSYTMRVYGVKIAD